MELEPDSLHDLNSSGNPEIGRKVRRSASGEKERAKEREEKRMKERVKESVN
jgi:hypothetical protein